MAAETDGAAAAAPGPYGEASEEAANLVSAVVDTGAKKEKKSVRAPASSKTRGKKTLPRAGAGHGARADGSPSGNSNIVLGTVFGNALDALPSRDSVLQGAADRFAPHLSVLKGVADCVNAQPPWIRRTLVYGGPLLTLVLLLLLLHLARSYDGACQDKQSQTCPMWANAGQCKLNPTFMQESCRESCGLCFSRGSKQYVGRMGTVNVERIKQTLAARSVLLLGCSIDRYAMEEFCRGANVPLTATNLSGGSRATERGCQVCSVGGFDMAFCQHNGAGVPPYWLPIKTGVLQTLTGSRGSRARRDWTPVQRSRWQQYIDRELAKQIPSETVIREFVPRFAASSSFGHADPDMVLLDSALWDLAKWWQRRGRPQTVPPVEPFASDIQEWCHKSIPETLRWVKETFPRSSIAFQVPPTILQATDGRSPTALDEMSACIKKELQGQDIILIDYHKIMDDMMARGGDREEVFRPVLHQSKKTWGRDPVHPAPKVSNEYINAILTRVAEMDMQPPSHVSTRPSQSQTATAINASPVQALPEGWKAVPAKSAGKVYYYNAKTRETRWTRP